MESDVKALAKEIGLFKEDIEHVKGKADEAQRAISSGIDEIKKTIVDLQTQLSEYVTVLTQWIPSN